MNLADALLGFLPRVGGVVTFVGAGGKTSGLFRLAEEASARFPSVLVTTTTHMLDPRCEAGRPALRMLFQAQMEGPPPGGWPSSALPGITVLAAREATPGSKIKGIHPAWIPDLLTRWGLVLVEADGSKGRPVKAPAAHEPVLPPGAGPVVGVVGLDCLGRPMDGATVHRPECFQAVTGCAPGQAIRWEHLEALVAHPQGLFKGASGPRVVLLNKADAGTELPSRAQLLGLAAQQVLWGSLRAGEGGIVALREVPWP
jgi:probable selenium-dependent hydroxylase accessory protein YqeC